MTKMEAVVREANARAVNVIPQLVSSYQLSEAQANDTTFVCLTVTLVRESIVAVLFGLRSSAHSP